MTDTSDERSPRFSRAILVRIVAVLAFVCLGTFAVVQSVIGRNEKSDTVASSESEEQPSDELQLESKSDSDDAPLVSTLPSTSMSFSGNPSKEGFDAPRPKSFKSGEFGKPDVPSFPTKKTAPPNDQSSFQAKAVSTGSSQQPSASTPPSLQPNSRSVLPIVVGKQATSATPPPSQSFSGQSFSDNSDSKPISGQTRSTPPPSLRLATPTIPKTLTPSNDNSFTTQSTPSPTATGTPANQPPTQTRDIANNSLSSAPQVAPKTMPTVSAPGVQNGTRSTTLNETPSSNAMSSNNGTPSSRSSFRSAAGPPKSNSISGQQTPPAGLPATQPKTSFPNASFGTQDLKPFAQSPPPSSSSPPSFSGTSPRVRSAPTQFTNLNPTTQGSTAPGTQQLRGALNPAAAGQTTRQPFSQASTRSTPSSSAPISSNHLPSVNTPGDRQLEGVQASALTIEKIAPREIQVNQPANFQIVVRNSGRSTASEVVVYDSIPKGTEFISAVPQPTRTGGQDLRWNLGEMRPGQEKRIKIQLKPVSPGEIGSVARVTFSSQASMRTRVTKPVLEIRHTARPKVLIGDNVVLDVIIENKGDGPANNVLIQEDVPDQLEFPDGTRELEYAVGTLVPGQSKRIRLSLRATAIGRLKNVIVATASGGLKAQHAVDMEVIAPQLIATGTGPKRKFLKRQATYTFSVENQGTADATNVELIARLPGGLQFVAANNRGKYDANTHAVYWSLAELTPKMVGTVEIKTLPIESGEQDITFEATADLNQRSKTTQSLMVEHLIDVFFDIDDVADPIETGSPTSYRIKIINQGTKAATNIKIQVDFPNGMLPTSVDGSLPNEIRGQQVIFAPITSMNPGDEMTIVVNSQGTAPGDHRIIVRLQTDGRATSVSKEETTHVYDDR